MSRSEFNQIMGLMVATINQEFPTEQAESYFLLLNDIPSTVLKTAVLRAIEESRQNFIPAVGVIRSHASAIATASFPSWGVEWERVNVAIRKFGHNQKAKAYEFLGPFTAAIVKQIGWDFICQSETVGVQMGQFRNLYESAVESEANSRRLGEVTAVNSYNIWNVFAEKQKRLAVNK